MKPSSQQKLPSSNSHSNKRSASNNSLRGRGRGRGGRGFIAQDREENNHKRNYNDSTHVPQLDNGERFPKKPKRKEYPPKNSKKNPGESIRGSNSSYNPRVDQRYTDSSTRPPYNPTYYERAPHVPCGSEMFYPTGRLPTGMFVNRQLNDYSRTEEANDNTTDDVPSSPKTSLITRSHFLLKTMAPRNKSHVAVPFLQCNPSEKSSTKESSAAENVTNKAPNPASAASTSEKVITEKEKDDGPSLEEVERAFQSFEKVKQELSDNVGSDPQPPSTGSREFENSPRPSSSSVLNQSVDFTSDTLPFNYQFSPAIMNEYNFPDPHADKNAMVYENDQSIANLRTRKRGLMQHSKDLTSQLHRVLTEIEIIDIEIDQFKSFTKMMFPGMAAPPRRPPPAVGKLAPFINIYNDPFKWSLAKSVVGFIGGVLLARQISEELVTMAASP
uniref:Uncharacterized protein n=1 Tax=Panagrolaimus sp. ES5 TaxID=591445 RepID=A0AC34F9S5_9BILA